MNAATTESEPFAALALLDYRRRVAEMYRELRDGADRLEARVASFRAQKDALFRDHPASPLPAWSRAGFEGLRYAPYDPAWRAIGRIGPERASGEIEVDAGADGRIELRRAAYLHVELAGSARRLTAFWMSGYGGGLFVPFGDTSNGRSAAEGGSYGGGRYLIDTIKHADLGSESGGLVLDFNAAYAPSCAYDPRWVCPLTPPENVLDLEVPVGELALLP